MMHYLARGGLAVLAVSVALLALAPPAFALPPGGTDDLQISAQGSFTSRLGQETIHFTGLVTIERSDPYDDGGLSVVDLEITALSLTGESVTGPITITQSATKPSLGELRSDEPGEKWPASAYLDVFVDVTAPASPEDSITKYNQDAIRITPSVQGEEFSISSWPPTAIPWAADLTECVPLYPVNPKGVCVTALSLTMSASYEGVGGVSELPALTVDAGGQGSLLVIVLAGLGVAIAAGAVVLIGRRFAD